MKLSDSQFQQDIANLTEKLRRDIEATIEAGSKILPGDHRREFHEPLLVEMLTQFRDASTTAKLQSNRSCNRPQ